MKPSIKKEIKRFPLINRYIYDKYLYDLCKKEFIGLDRKRSELINFASKLDYNDNRINGNVIDFILSPNFFNKHMDKALSMIKGGIKQGMYQMQINVVDSKTLIEAQKNPELFPNLVVRAWGFSAYFKDLPKDYQDNLIRRSKESEKKM